MLKTGLELRGFKKSIADPCVFMKGPSTNGRSGVAVDTSNQNDQDHVFKFKHALSDILVLAYVDDCIILSRERSSIICLFIL